MNGRATTVSPASSAQERVWFLCELEPGSGPAHNLSTAVLIEGKLHKPALAQAISTIIARHDTLRATFVVEEGHLRQTIAATADVKIRAVDLCELPVESRAAEVRRLTAEEAAKPFDLAGGLLIRATLVRLEEERHVLLVTMHRISADERSLAVFLQELTALYAAEVNGRPAELPALPQRYADIAAGQREWLEGADMQEQLAYWRSRLAGLAALEVPADRPRPAVQTFRGAVRTHDLQGSLVRQLERLSRNEGVTLFITLLAAFQVLLSRHSGQQDIAVGTATSGRTHAQREGLIGPIANDLVMRTDLSGNPSFRELLGRVREVCLGAYAHRDLPFETLLDHLRLERDLSRSPLFQVTFDLQEGPVFTRELPDLRFTAMDVEAGTARYDLSLSVVRRGELLRAGVTYNRDLFDPVTIDRILSRFQVLLEGIVAEPGRAIDELPLLPEAERQLLAEWSQGPAEAVPAACLHELVEEQAARTPEATALVAGGERLTYRELNSRANQMAHYLRSLGVGPGRLVGVYLRRTADLAVALLGTWKAGGAYVPLDPAYPSERVGVTLAEARVAVLLTEEPLLGDLPAQEGRVVCLEQVRDALAQMATANPVSGATTGDLAYVLYTSGSTGRPKGVALEHRCAVNFAHWGRRAFTERELSGVLAATSVSFDLSIFELFVPLCWGGKVVLADNALHLADLPAAAEVRLINTVPSAMAELVRMDAIPASVCTVNLAGEPLQSGLVQQLYAQEQIERVYNLYGPTETTTYSTFTLVDRESAAPPAIGRPVLNTQVYLLDEQLRPVPVGVPGELYIGGAGVARGYLNQPELTGQRFVADPFIPGMRMYRTGDLVRYRGDSNLEYLGRLDHQVKLRGFRIELGEIETVLDHHPAVRQAVVVAREVAPGSAPVEKRLVAYVVAETAGNTVVDELRTYLRAKLPDYMVPAAFVLLDALPLTPNGKVDRKALPAVAIEHLLESRPYSPPRTATEELVASLWLEVLGLERVGRDDDFFDLGGHSLLATRVISRTRQVFAVELSLPEFFAAPTLCGLAAVVERKRSQSAAQASPILPVPRNEPLPLSFAQQRLWFLDQYAPDSAVYNMVDGFHIDGPLQVEALRKGLEEVVQRHESLRTTFAATAEGTAVQVVAETVELPLPVVDLSALAQAERQGRAEELAAAEARSPFDLSRGPLVRSTLLKLAETEHVLLLTMHHIVSDGWSIGVLWRELSALYEAFAAGKESPLPPLPVQYADFAQWQQQWLQGERLQEQLSYWESRLKGSPSLLELPTDHRRPTVQSFQGAIRWFTLSRELADSLRALSRREGATLFMTLLAALDVLLSRYARQEDICVGTPIANRNRAEIEDLIGFFTNTLVMRTDLSGNPSFRELVGRVREACLGAYAHQDLPFEQVVEALQPERDLSRHPLFQVMFVLQNAADEVLRLGDLPMRRMPVDLGLAKLDLLLDIQETGQGLSCSLEYSTDLFDEATIARMIDHFQVLLEGIVAEPGRAIDELPLLPEAERQLLAEWSQGPAEAVPAACLHELVEEQAERTPEATALVAGGERLTYRELNSRANQMAHYLRSLGVGPGRLVGVYLRRTADLAVALLGTWKAGGAYVPLDPAYPSERVGVTLAEARVAVLLTEEPLLGDLPAQEGRVVCLEQVRDALAQMATANPVSGATTGDLAYVLYTSGSTGRPKGVALEHRCAVNFAHWGRRAFTERELSGVLAATSVSFDLSIFELFVPLCWGGKVVLADNALHLADLPAAAEVRLINTVPSAMAELVRMDAIPASVCTVNLAGEPLQSGLVQQLYAHEQIERVYNLYGPTETTTYSTFTLVDRESAAPPAIGRPVLNTQVYLLDEQLRPVPVGVPGELYIGGAGVARGYLNQPELTGQRFVADPFIPGMRMYRTGDLVRYRGDSNLEYLGRLDHQVKLRGFRIELGEIETVLDHHPAVRQAVVVAREVEKRLVAYVVAETAGNTVVDELRTYLRAKLPDYMVPAAFVLLDALPLTPNGKVDRKSLPDPEGEAFLSGEYVAPGNATEELLADIFAEVLHLDQVSIHSNFFDLGGHSLLVMQVLARLYQATRVRLPVQTLFVHPTVAGLAEALKEVAPPAAADAAPDGEQLRAEHARSLLARLGELSDEEVEALLRELGEDGGID